MRYAVLIFCLGTTLSAQAVTTPAASNPPARFFTDPLPIVPGAPVTFEAVPPGSATAQAPDTSFAFHPSTIVGLGGGGVIPGGGYFGYEQISIYMGSNTYITQATQLVSVGGQIQTCSLAGATKVEYQPGPFSFGMTGLGGACESTTGNAGGAVSGQFFGAWHVGKTPFVIIITGQKTWTTSGKSAAKVTLGLDLVVKP